MAESSWCAEVLEAGDRFELSVSDTGVGIAEEDREIIFEKFRQSNAVLGHDGLTREYSGTGLGLSIVKELCKLLGGEIDFESELGKGSVFRVVLPLTCEVRAGGDARCTCPMNRPMAPRSRPLDGSGLALLSAPIHAPHESEPWAAGPRCGWAVRAGVPIDCRPDP